jgi:hypothetical protein
MQYSILFDRNENIKEIEIKEQNRFVKSILEAIEVPLDEWNPDEPLSIDGKIKLRTNLAQYSINIIDDMDGGVKIYVETDIVAEWKKAKYILKTDKSHVDPKKRLYYQMNINFWSIWEEDNNE